MDGMIPQRCDFCLNVVDESGRHVDGFCGDDGMNVPDPGNDPDFCWKVLRSQLRSAQRAYHSIFKDWSSQARHRDDRHVVHAWYGPMGERHRDHAGEHRRQQWTARSPHRRAVLQHGLMR